MDLPKSAKWILGCCLGVVAYALYFVGASLIERGRQYDVYQELIMHGYFIPHSDYCTSHVEIGQLCWNTNQQKIYLGDGEKAIDIREWERLYRERRDN